MSFTDWAFGYRMDREREARLTGYKERWEFYRGDHPAKLKVKQDQADDNLTVNLYKKVVDSGLRFLFGKELTFEIKEGVDTPPEQALAAVWAANRKMVLLSQVGLNGGVCGHCFVKLIPDGLPDGVPRLVNLDPAIVSVKWDGDDIERRLAYRIQYEAADSKGQQIWKREDHEREAERPDIWTVKSYERRNDWQSWRLLSEEVWGYDWPAILDWQNLPAPNEFYGEPDVSADGIVLQNGVNFAASNMQRILRYHAHPRTIAEGMRKGKIEMGPDQIAYIPSGKLYNLEMQSDLSAASGFLRDLVGWMLQLGNLPDLDPAKVNVGALSGFAIRLLYSDLIFITELKRGTYGAALAELNRRLLEVMNKQSAGETRLHWPDPLPVADTEQVTALQADRALGIVSRETMASKRGYDWEVEQTRLTAEEEAETNLGEFLLRQFERGG